MAGPGRAGGTGGLDWFRPVAAALVVAIHTGPLLSWDTGVNYLLTDILARVAVPFFFAVTGFFLLPRVAERGWRALAPFLGRTALLYAGATLLYLPVNLYTGAWRGEGLAFRLARDLLFDGTFYHLWYFPAVLLGMVLVSALLRACRGRRAIPLLVCLALYLLGLLGDSYYGLAAALPPLAGMYDALFSLFSYTRNGLFFAPLFLLLGHLLARRAPLPRRRAALGLALSLAALAAEGLLVRRLGLARHDSMYLALPLCLWFLVDLLRALPARPRPALRTLSTVVYVVHPLCVLGLRFLSRPLGLLSADGFFLGNSLLHYLAVCALSALAALPLLLWKRRTRPAARRDRAWVEVDIAALRHNLAALRALLPSGCGLMAVVKANAYGHGDAAVARVCAEEGVKHFAVASLAEGAGLRRAGVRGDILVLGYTAPEEAPALARYRLTQTVVGLDHARALSRQGLPLRVQVKLDTGMHRLGLAWDDRDGLREVYSLPHLRVEGLFTHLSCAEGLDPDSRAQTEEQVRRFYDAAGTLRAAGVRPGLLHLQSSYGLLNYRDAVHSPDGVPPDLVRVGIALYGLLSSPGEHTRLPCALKPVLALRARVAEVRRLSAGEHAGYDGAFTARRPTDVAVVTIGYADGYPRALSGGRGGALVRGQYAPIAGLVCMDQLLLDVTGIPGVEAGDMVTLIGRDGDCALPAEAVARAAGTISNELLSRLGPRLERVLL